MAQVSSTILCVAGLGVMTALLGAQMTSRVAVLGPPSDADLRRVLAERIDAQGRGIGIIIGVIEPGGRRVISYGQLREGDLRALQGDTVFEIGSISKVFTALLLADMVQRREVALEDPLTKYLPIGTKVPERNGQPITLLDVATHTSGLPLMPDDLPSQLNDELAKAKYSAAQLYEFLARYEVSQQSGAKWGYSNIGYSLLGQALAARAGTDYETLLRTRVVAPLELRGTGITVLPNLKAEFAVGHYRGLQPAPPISTVPMMAVMMPAGGVLSTVNDLLTVLSVAMGHERSALTATMASMLTMRRPGFAGDQALGWMITGEGDDQLIVHDGGTFGFASSMVWNAKKRIGVVVLSNHAVPVGDLARRVLQSQRP